MHFLKRKTITEELRMVIDWTAIIVAIIGVFASGGIGALITMKFTRRKAKTEAESDANKEQSERIDLGNKYVDNMLQMLEKIQANQAQTSALYNEKNTENKEAWDAVTKKLNEVHDDLVGVKDEVTSIVNYLNGGYKKYKDEHPNKLEVLDNFD
jgi:ribosomal protein L16 Arg81 hydroxylase